jgi:hypothetical protein
MSVLVCMFAHGKQPIGVSSRMNTSITSPRRQSPKI